MTARQRRRGPVAAVLASTLAVALALVFVLGACADDRVNDAPSGDNRSVTETPEANGRNLPVLGEALMLALAQAKNYHHKADVLIKQAKVTEAAEALRAIHSIPFPEGAPEAEDVKLDARARLAKLLVTSGDVDGAMKVVDEGIANASRESFFVANLHTVKGEVYEAMANLLDDATGPETAEQAEARKARARDSRRSAIMSFDRAISINTELQKALLNESAQ